LHRTRSQHATLTFRAGPERAKGWAETEKDGPINLKVESIFVNPIDFSPIK
jgi:hypothetical protein